MAVLTEHSQSSDSPVTSTLLPSFNKQRQADEVDRWSDSQGADEFEHEAHQAGEAQDDLEQGGHQDGSLDLWRAGTETREHSTGFSLISRSERITRAPITFFDCARSDSD